MQVFEDAVAPFGGKN